jgi:hypothetical protein
MTDSKKLLDYWLPPEGAGNAIACLATSFSFDRNFFEGDCLSRFLGLDSRRGEGDDLAVLIEEQEKLSETRVSVLVDRSWSAEVHDLRWDVVAVGLRSGLQHSKVALLVWEKLVRVIVGSANLTRAGYRSQIETATVLDAETGSEVPLGVLLQCTGALRRLVDRIPGSTSTSGPKQKALATLDDAERRFGTFDLPQKVSGLDLGVISCEPGRSLFDQLATVWKGGPCRSATVVSPFFDVDESLNRPTESLSRWMAQRGDRDITFTIPVETAGGRTVLHAPHSILDSVPRSCEVYFRAFTQPEQEDRRRLHAKALLLESASWVLLVTGSSNFTVPGLGLDSRAGHFEINLACAAPADSRSGKRLLQLFAAYEGDPIDLQNVDWSPVLDEEEISPLVVPWGFQQALVDPAPPAKIQLQFSPRDLPATWRIALPAGAPLLTSEQYAAIGSPTEWTGDAGAGKLPLVLLVTWGVGADASTANWPINVTDASKLPPADELRNLPIEVLLEALASTRPLSEALSAALRKRERRLTQTRERDHLDPLKRYSESGRQLYRARRLSLALIGLRRRLERPASSLEAVQWRLFGPLGPIAIALAQMTEVKEGRAIPGEADFVLAELALTLTRVRWSVPGDLQKPTKELVEKVRTSLHALRDPGLKDAGLRRYVEDAFQEASAV